MVSLSQNCPVVWLSVQLEAKKKKKQSKLRSLNYHEDEDIDDGEEVQQHLVIAIMEEKSGRKLDEVPGLADIKTFHGYFHEMFPTAKQVLTFELEEDGNE
jgi:hypothetical protein